MNGIAEQKHSPDGKKCGGADAASLGGPLVMQYVIISNHKKGAIMNLKTRINEITFVKSSFSGTRRCVGVAIEKEKVVVTNTKTKHSIVEFTFDEWEAFLKGVKNDEFEIESLAGK